MQELIHTEVYKLISQCLNRKPSIHHYSNLYISYIDNNYMEDGPGSNLLKT